MALKHIETSVDGDVTTIRFTEPKLFDSMLLTELQEQLIGFVEDDPPEKLLVDFSEVEFCSTSLINTLLNVKKIVVGDGAGQLKMCGMQKSVREAFQMLNLDGTVFQIYDGPDEAIGAFE